MAQEPPKSLMRSLGEFVGHVWRGVKTDPSAPQRQILRHEVQEQTLPTPRGKAVLRRTTIEEVEIQPPPKH